MRPALKPGLIAVWRDRDTVQIGIDPRRAVALTGMREAARLLGLLDGSRDREQILAAAVAELGIGAEAADRIIGLLAAGGVLADFPAGTYRMLSRGPGARLAPELATAAIAHGDGDGGARTLARRQQACVQVRGLSRAGLSIASLLAASGVGLVISTGHVPGEQVLEELPGTAKRLGVTERPGMDRRPDLVILADTYRREWPAALVRSGVCHLSATASEAIGMVGPLVLPGRTACLHCLDLARAERDPAWPMILAQLASRAADPPACDSVLAATVAALAAAAALVFLDRGAPGSAVRGTPGRVTWHSSAPDQALVNGTLELVLPAWQWRRRTWTVHPRCGCGSTALRHRQ